jgi:glutamate 5-kinase
MSSLAQAKRVVIKLGTGVLTSGIGDLDTDRINTLCKQVIELRSRGIEVVLVSSGAVGLGMGKLNLKKRPEDLAQLQACASVGQSILINTWQNGFNPHDTTVAQILLTREDLRSRNRHNAIFNTIECLIKSGAIPIVNENDSVSAAEIKFGDNDTLSALVASVVSADMLLILSNIPGLIDRCGSGKVVDKVEAITPDIEAMADGTTETTSVGGMTSKITAAKIACRAGCDVIVGSGKDDLFFTKLLNKEPIGTHFLPNPEPVMPHKRWIAIQDSTDGKLMVNDSVAESIIQSGENLLIAGITNIDGNFSKDSIVSICKNNGSVIAQGQVELNSLAIKDNSLTDKIVVHRDNLVLLH